MEQTVRLQDFANIVGRDRDALRTEEQRENAPWQQDDFPEGSKQRRYSGFHTLAMVAREHLASQGLSNSQASEHVRIQAHLLREFLHATTTKVGAKKTLVVASYLGIFSDFTGFCWEPTDLVSTGSVEEIEKHFSYLLRKVGTERTFGKFGHQITERVVCGPMVAVADLHEAYRMAQARAASAGFALHGFDLTSLSGSKGKA